VGCNCGKTKINQQFVYTDKAGATKVYKTEVEARAAVIRSGGGTYRAVPVR